MCFVHQECVHIIRVKVRSVLKPVCIRVFEPCVEYFKSIYLILLDKTISPKAQGLQCYLALPTLFGVVSDYAEQGGQKSG